MSNTYTHRKDLGIEEALCYTAYYILSVKKYAWGTIAKNRSEWADNEDVNLAINVFETLIFVFATFP